MFVRLVDQLLSQHVLLVVILLVRANIDEEWLEVPGDVYVCEGQNATLRWEFDETHGNLTTVQGVLVIKKQPESGKTITFLTRTGGSEPKFPEGRTVVAGNAGILLIKTRVEDTGEYRSSVYYTAEHQIHNSAYLTVYPRSECPDVDLLKNPRLQFRASPGGYLYHESQDELVTVVGQAVHIGVEIPGSDPPTSVVLTLGTAREQCNGTGTLSVCWVHNIFSVPGNQVFNISFRHNAHPELAPYIINMKVLKSIESLILPGDVITPGSVTYGTTKDGIPIGAESGQQGAPGLTAAVSILAIFCVLFLVLLLLVVCWIRQQKQLTKCRKDILSGKVFRRQVSNGKSPEAETEESTPIAMSVQPVQAVDEDSQETGEPSSRQGDISEKINSPNVPPVYAPMRTPDEDKDPKLT